MPFAGIDGKWRDRSEQTYFVKLESGGYVRMRFQMDAGVSRVFRTQTTGVAGTNHYRLEGHDHYPKPEQGTSRAYTQCEMSTLHAPARGHSGAHAQTG
jgi:hypothetical protein